MPDFVLLVEFWNHSIGDILSFLSNAGYGSNALRQTHVPKASSNLDATKRCPGSTLPSTWDLGVTQRID